MRKQFARVVLWLFLLGGPAVYAQSGMTELDPKSLLVAGIVLLYLLYRKICSLA